MHAAEDDDYADLRNDCVWIPLETLPPDSAQASSAYPPGGELDDPFGLNEPGPEPAHPPVRIITVDAEPVAPASEPKPVGADPSRPVGYGNPPKHGQQQPGAPSKNPNGRPKGSPNTGHVSKFLSKRSEQDLGTGKPEQVSRAEFLKWVIHTRAAEGDHRFRKIRDDQIRAEQRLADLRLELEIKRAEAGEKLKAPAQLEGYKWLEAQRNRHFGVVKRARDVGILVEVEGGYAFAEGFLEALKDWGTV